LFEGVVEGLSELERRGYVLAVATGKSRNGLDKALQSTGLRRYFPWHQCADETASKPDPLMLSNILAGAQCSVSDAVMVGDTIYDMEMARRIGMTAFGVEYGVHSADQLLGSGARATFSTFCELIDSLLVH
ncbi:MAG: HAD-IA family hydrolase, partial [Pseudomonadales bacterium]|nr:HAD-IA family hydrolase [Pseudomonadales bacterium]